MNPEPLILDPEPYTGTLTRDSKTINPHTEHP